jgi:cobalt/nickel transport system permease protein
MAVFSGWDKRTRRFFGLYLAAIAVFLATTAMHIPDGYLSPLTSAILYALVLPFWAIGLRQIKRKMNARSVPLIALMASFSFVIMMFNVPLIGGTTGHAVGATLAAIVLGPEIATIAVSIALIIQALLAGDGGILAIGANCFNMAVVMPYLAYYIYRAISGNSPVTSSRRLAGAAVGGWVALTVAAFVAAIEFGLQPLLFTAADGTPLYAPYPLSIAIPAMVGPHALIASVIEGGLTALIIGWMQRSNPAVLEAPEKSGMVAAEETSMGRLKWLWVGIAALVVAAPLGLLAPGTAWGEWGTEELAQMGIKVPQGMAQLSTLWGAPLADYDIPALGNANLGYVISGAVGIAVVALVVWLFTALLTRTSTPRASQ